MHEKNVTSFNIQDGTVKRKGMALCKKKYIISAIIVLIIIIAIILAVQFGLFERKEAQEEFLSPPNPSKPLPASGSILHNFKKSAVCADSVPCSEIGSYILKQNGSAVDAAIATMFCDGLYNMQSMGIGGGFLMTIYKRDEKKAYVLNAREVAPFKSKEDMFGSNEDLKSREGALAIGVPGELRGYWEAHQKFGKLPWKEVLKPALEVCEQGYNISKPLHSSLIMKKYLIEKDPNLREWFLDEEGKVKKLGSVVKPKKLCETLRLISENGVDEFYNGTIAKKMVKDVKEMGGIITEEDLANYTAKWMDPIKVTLNDETTIYSVPPPGSGVILSFILRILDGFGFNSTSISDVENTVLTFHRTVEAFKYAYAKRTELGDTDFVNITELLTNMTSTNYADDIRLKIKDNSTSQEPKDYGAVFYQVDDHGTAHISVLSEEGDAVSVTSTVNIYMGCGLTSKSTGVLFNSGMDDFSSKGFKNFFGLPGSPNNAIAPGKRPLSSMSPSILVDKNGDVKMVVGAAGGTKIPSAIAQVIMRSLWFGQNVKEAVDAPRIHHQVYPMTVDYEYGVLQQVIDGLERIGHKTHRFKDVGSVVCALLKNGQEIIGNADYRKGGGVNGI